MTHKTPPATPATHYEAGRKYPTTEVLGWWMTPPRTSPRWHPVMGGLHDDARFFDFDELHHHVDPRFLPPFLDHRLSSIPWGTPWHAAYHEVMTFFALENDRTHYLVMTARESRVVDRITHKVRERLDRAWGECRVQRRERLMTCRQALPPADLRDEMAPGFEAIRQEFADAAGDTCPHKGYDLRNVPVDRDGFRQCPLHQLRVRACALPENAPRQQAAGT